MLLCLGFRVCVLLSLGVLLDRLIAAARLLGVLLGSAPLLADESDELSRYCVADTASAAHIAATDVHRHVGVDGVLLGLRLRVGVLIGVGILLTD